MLTEETMQEESTTKFGSGFHDESPQEISLGEECLSEQPTVVESPAEVVKPEQQAFIGDDGQVHEIPAELIGPDGKMLPFNEKTMRMLRNKYFTVRHVLLTDCGHKIDMINQPKTNCENCWYNWMNRHGQLVQTAHEFYQEHGKDKLIAMRGKVFTKMFLRFMSTVSHFLAQQKEQEQANGHHNQQGQVGSTSSGAGDGEGSSSSPLDSGRQAESGEVVND